MMIWRQPEPNFDVASAQSQGARDYQEDAIVTDFPIGLDCGFVVLADGMGGHAAGDIASKTVVTEVFSKLKFKLDEFMKLHMDIPAILEDAAATANVATMRHVAKHPEAFGMGATLVSAVFVADHLFWLSIGDSPLFVLRDGKLSQLNQDHSLAPQIDFMVRSGLLDAAAAKNHPNRNCLTSVIMGEKIAKTDCPQKPYPYKPGDIFIVASDGLQFLENAQIEKILLKNRKKRSCEIARLLLASLEALNDPDQDNITLSVVKINQLAQAKRPLKPSANVAKLQHAPTALAKIDDDGLLTQPTAADDQQHERMFRTASM